VDEKTRKFYAKVEKYGGWKQVPSEKVLFLFEEIIAPARLGFAKAKRGYFARQVNADLIHVLKLDHLKGGACGISYGVSLSYLPYPFLPTVKWHRTLKSVSLDLCEQPQVDFPTMEDSSPEPEPYIASTMLGEDCFRAECGSAWQRASLRILAWFEATRTLEGVLARCADQLSRPQLALCRIPVPVLFVRSR